MLEHQYKPPEGYQDIPFFYVFDGRGQTPGASPNNLLVRIQDSDFLLRSVVGMDTTAGTWRYYYASQSPAQDSQITTTPRYTVVPEEYFQALSGIRFDLSTVALAVNPSALPVSFIGFQGVKRVHQGQFGWSDYQTEYQYWEKPYLYQMTLNLNFFADAGAGARRFGVAIRDRDFQLQTIYVRRTDVDAPIGADPFLVELFDPTGFNSLSTAPFPVRWLNGNQGGNYFSSFPVPSLLYPVNSRINFDVTTLLNAAEGPRTYEFVFSGVERMPC